MQGGTAVDVGWLVGPLWEGYHEKMLKGHLPDTYPETYITKYTSIRRLFRVSGGTAVDVVPPVADPEVQVRVQPCRFTPAFSSSGVRINRTCQVTALSTGSRAPCCLRVLVYSVIYDSG